MSSSASAGSLRQRHSRSSSGITSKRPSGIGEGDVEGIDGHNTRDVNINATTTVRRSRKSTFKTVFARYWNGILSVFGSDHRGYLTNNQNNKSGGTDKNDESIDVKILTDMDKLIPPQLRSAGYEELLRSRTFIFVSFIACIMLVVATMLLESSLSAVSSSFLFGIAAAFVVNIVIFRGTSTRIVVGFAFALELFLATGVLVFGTTWPSFAVLPLFILFGGPLVLIYFGSFNVASIFSSCSVGQIIFFFCLHLFAPFEKGRNIGRMGMNQDMESFNQNYNFNFSHSESDFDAETPFFENVGYLSLVSWIFNIIVIIVFSLLEEASCRRAREDLTVVVRQLHDVAYEVKRERDTVAFADEKKINLMKRVSGDLRKPLIDIISCTASLLELEGLSNEQREHVAMVRQCSDDMLSLSSDIAQYMAIEAGKSSFLSSTSPSTSADNDYDTLNLNTIDFDIHTLLEELSLVLAPPIYSKGVELVCHVARQVPPYVRGNDIALRHVVTGVASLLRKNLDLVPMPTDVVMSAIVHSEVSNRVEILFDFKLKFRAVNGNEGGVEGGRGEGEGEDVTWLEQLLAYVDAKMVKIERAKPTRASTHTTHSPVVAVSFVAAYEKQLNCRREPSAYLAAVEGRTALCAVRSKTVAGVILHHLQALNMVCDYVSDSRQAVSLMDRAEQRGRQYELIVLDSSLNGAEAFIRAQRAASVNHVEPQRKHQAKQSKSGRKRATKLMILLPIGRRIVPSLVNIAIPKPVSAASIENALVRMFNPEISFSFSNTGGSGGVGLRTGVGMKRMQQQQQQQQHRLVGRDVGAGTGSGPHHHHTQTINMLPPGVSMPSILIAQADEVSLRVAFGVLRKLGFKAEIARSGLEVLDAVKKKRRDLIFLDLELPQLDGLQAVAELRKAYPKGEGVVIVAMTAHVLPGDREMANRVGMDDFLPKPLTVSTVKSVLSKWLSAMSSSNSRRNRPSATAPTRPSPTAYSGGGGLALAHSQSQVSLSLGVEAALKITGPQLAPGAETKATLYRSVSLPSSLKSFDGQAAMSMSMMQWGSQSQNQRGRNMNANVSSIQSTSSHMLAGLHSHTHTNTSQTSASVGQSSGPSQGQVPGQLDSSVLVNSSRQKWLANLSGFKARAAAILPAMFYVPSRILSWYTYTGEHSLKHVRERSEEKRKCAVDSGLVFPATPSIYPNQSEALSTNNSGSGSSGQGEGLPRVNSLARFPVWKAKAELGRNNSGDVGVNSPPPTPSIVSIDVVKGKGKGKGEGSGGASMSLSRLGGGGGQLKPTAVRRKLALGGEGGGEGGEGDDRLFELDRGELSAEKTKTKVEAEEEKDTKHVVFNESQDGEESEEPFDQPSISTTYTYTYRNIGSYVYRTFSKISNVLLWWCISSKFAETASPEAFNGSLIVGASALASTIGSVALWRWAGGILTLPIGVDHYLYGDGDGNGDGTDQIFLQSSEARLFVQTIAIIFGLLSVLAIILQRIGQAEAARRVLDMEEEEEEEGRVGIDNPRHPIAAANRPILPGVLVSIALTGVFGIGPLLVSSGGNGFHAIPVIGRVPLVLIPIVLSMTSPASFASSSTSSQSSSSSLLAGPSSSKSKHKHFPLTLPPTSILGVLSVVSSGGLLLGGVVAAFSTKLGLRTSYASIHSHSFGEGENEGEYMSMSMWIVLGEAMTMILVILGLGAWGHAREAKRGKYLAARLKAAREARDVQRALQDVRDCARNVQKSRVIVLSHISRDSRVPLNGLIGLGELLLWDRHKEKDELFVPPTLLQPYVTTLRRSGEKFLMNVERLLEHAAMESGVAALDDVDFDLHSLVEEIVKLMIPTAARRGVTLACIVPRGVPAAARGDRLRLRQTIVNLLTSAISTAPEMGGEAVIGVSADRRHLREHYHDKNAVDIVIEAWDVDFSDEERMDKTCQLIEQMSGTVALGQEQLERFRNRKNKNKKSRGAEEDEGTDGDRDSDETGSPSRSHKQKHKQKQKHRAVSTVFGFTLRLRTCSDSDSTAVAATTERLLTQGDELAKHHLQGQRAIVLTESGVIRAVLEAHLAMWLGIPIQHTSTHDELCSALQKAKEFLSSEGSGGGVIVIIDLLMLDGEETRKVVESVSRVYSEVCQTERRMEKEKGKGKEKQKVKSLGLGLGSLASSGNLADMAMASQSKPSGEKEEEKEKVGSAPNLRLLLLTTPGGRNHLIKLSNREEGEDDSDDDTPFNFNTHAHDPVKIKIMPFTILPKPITATSISRVLGQMFAVTATVNVNVDVDSSSGGTGVGVGAVSLQSEGGTARDRDRESHSQSEKTVRHSSSNPHLTHSGSTQKPKAFSQSSHVPRHAHTQAQGASNANAPGYSHSHPHSRQGQGQVQGSGQAPRDREREREREGHFKSYQRRGKGKGRSDHDYGRERDRERERSIFSSSSASNLPLSSNNAASGTGTSAAGGTYVVPHRRDRPFKSDEGNGK